MGAKPIGTKLLPLTEVIDINYAKIDMVIHKKELTLPIKDEDLDKDAQTCELQGTVNVGSYPRYRQKGTDELVLLRDRYLCVKIIEAKVFEDFRDGGEALVWIECFWGGVMKKTRIFKKENVQQTLYFKISIPPDIKKNQAKLEEYL